MPKLLDVHARPHFISPEAPGVALVVDGQETLLGASQARALGLALIRASVVAEQEALLFDTLTPCEAPRFLLALRQRRRRKGG